MSVSSFSACCARENVRAGGELQDLSAKQDDMAGQLKKMEALLGMILSKIDQGEIKQIDIPQKVADVHPVDWNEWVKIKKELNNLDADNNQYILIVDKVDATDTEYMKAFANFPWKIVFDLDPNSEEDGILSQIKRGETACGIVVTHTPRPLANRSDHQTDSKRVHWIFANGLNEGQAEDKPKDKFEDWRRSYGTAIQDHIRMCCEKLDKLKPTFCIILPLREPLSIQIAESIAHDLEGRFLMNGFTMSFVSHEPDLKLEEFPRSIFSPLSLKFVSLGIHALLGINNEQYQMPSNQRGLFVPLPNLKYNYVNEFLEILYKGCEEIPTELSEAEERSFENEHLKSFIQGNPITFESLHYGHDAQRTLSKDIYRRIDTMPRLSTSQIVQISHAPGSGGSTIARRVLWDLHTKYPCAIVRMDRIRDFTGTEPEVQQFVAAVADRIGEIEKICEVWPVALVDGDSRMVRIISDQLVRKLDPESKRAIVIRSVYFDGTEKESDCPENFFSVKPVLEDEKEDLQEFRKKYKDYCKRFQRKGYNVDGSTRVFHFPMMAMLGYSDELKRIVTECLNKIKKESPLEYEVAVLVAYLQKYSNLEVPASLITQYFKWEYSTYHAIAESFSENLLNLMVSKKAPNMRKWIGGRTWSDNDSTPNKRFADMFPSADSVSHWYTFQHHAVAENVLLHSERDLQVITKELVDSPVLDRDHRKSEIATLMNNLFLYNKENDEDRFSLLVQTLNDEGELFEQAARKTKSATFFSHVARFIAYHNRDFDKAKELIAEGINVGKEAHMNLRGVLETEGHILLREMISKKNELIKTVEDLEHYADVTIQKFRKARDRPPMSFPNPLLGEVKVWLFCFDWIIKWKGGNVEEAKKLIMQERSYFYGSISQCFLLLDHVDQMVQSTQALVSPVRSKTFANASRVNLMNTFQFGVDKTRGKPLSEINLYSICEELCSKKNFPYSSEKEIKRLRVAMMINQAERKLHLLSDFDRRKLFEMLEELVCKQQLFEYAHYLMNVAIIQRTAPFILEKALDIVTRWQRNLPHDSMAYFYEYVFCFLKVRCGEVMEYRSRYEEALKNCERMSQGNIRRYMHQFYIKNSAERSDSICQLISGLELGTKQDRDQFQGPKAYENQGQEFWKGDGRKFLLECNGKITVKQASAFKCKEYPIIYLEPGNLQIDVPPKDVGKPYSDYNPGSKVKFLVCFTLAGPKAKGIAFL